MNHRRGQGIHWASAFVMVAALAPAARAADSPRAAIEAANQAFVEALGRGDAAAVAALYDANGAVMPAASEPVRGSEAIRKFWGGVIEAGLSANLKTVEVYGRGATATEVGEYELKDKSGKVVDHGKYIVVWSHHGTQWKLLRDMFSSNVPAPAKS